MEIPFRKVAFADKPLIDRYLAMNTHKSCELSFANIYLWSRFYPTEFAVVEDTVVFRSFVEDNGMSVSFPAGEKPQIRKALDTLFVYFKDKGCPVRLHLVQEQDFALLEQWYPGRFAVVYDRDVADYVYETEKLTTLAGKKLHGKRNHINNFKKQYPDWSYERITEANQEDCFNMAMKWRQGHVCEYSEDEQDEEKRDEMCVTLNALRLREELGLIGGLIRVDGQVVAFSIGEPLNPDTFVVHIEKALADVEGAYPMINQQFVEHEAQAFRYVNREEDTGSEGLRKAKLSYKPIFFVNKGMVHEKKEED